MASETTPRRFVWAVGVSIAATTVLTAWIALGVGGRTVTTYVDDIATVVAALVATALCVLAARSGLDTKRKLWSLLAVALGLWALAETVWAVTSSSFARMCRPLRGPTWAISVRSSSQSQRSRRTRQPDEAPHARFATCSTVY